MICREEKSERTGASTIVAICIRHCDLEETCVSIVDNILNSRDCPET